MSDTENLDKLKKTELEAEAEKLGVSAEGNKEDILARVEEKLEQQSTDYVPDFFLARFDPTNPPADDLGPVTEA